MSVNIVITEIQDCDVPQDNLAQISGTLGLIEQTLNSATTDGGTQVNAKLVSGGFDGIAQRGYDDNGVVYDRVLRRSDTGAVLKETYIRQDLVEQTEKPAGFKLGIPTNQPAVIHERKVCVSVNLPGLYTSSALNYIGKKTLPLTSPFTQHPASIKQQQLDDLATTPTYKVGTRDWVCVEFYDAETGKKLCGYSGIVGYNGEVGLPTGSLLTTQIFGAKIIQASGYVKCVVRVKGHVPLRSKPYFLLAEPENSPRQNNIDMQVIANLEKGVWRGINASYDIDTGTGYAKPVPGDIDGDGFVSQSDIDAVTAKAALGLPNGYYVEDFTMNGLVEQEDVNLATAAKTAHPKPFFSATFAAYLFDNSFGKKADTNGKIIPLQSPYSYKIFDKKNNASIKDTAVSVQSATLSYLHNSQSGGVYDWVLLVLENENFKVEIPALANGSQNIFNPANNTLSNGLHLYKFDVPEIIPQNFDVTVKCSGFKDLKKKNVIFERSETENFKSADLSSSLVEDTYVQHPTSPHMLNMIAGDVDGDGVVTQADVDAVAAKAALNLPRGYYKEDYNFDGFVTSADVTIAQSRLGL